MKKKNDFTDYRIQLHDRIIEHARKKFFTQGIKVTKMDDIAADLAISKRTLYEIFGNKETLLLAIVEKQMNDYNYYLKEKQQGGFNSIDIILDFYMMNLRAIQCIKPSIYEEIKSYQSLREFIEKRRIERKGLALEFFNRGVEEGVFRSDVDYDLILDLGEAHNNFVHSNAKYYNRNLVDVFRNTFMVTIRGISTMKGLQLIEDYLQKVEVNTAG